MPTRREILMSTGALAGVSMLSANAKPLVSAVQDDVPIPGSVDKALNIWDLKAMAKERLTEGHFAHIMGGAADEITVRWNREGFDKIRLRPNVLIDPTQIDTSTILFGQKLAYPVLLGPTGGHRSTHPDGELATAPGVRAMPTPPWCSARSLPPP